MTNMANLLDSASEVWWATKVRDVLSASSIDVDEIISWYGGMGSINDLTISRFNGHAISREQEAPLNEQFDGIRTDLYKLAVILRDGDNDVKME